MQHKYIDQTGVASLIESLGERYSVYVPAAVGDGLHLVPHTSANSPSPVTVGEVRSCEPLKAFFFPARQCVARDLGLDVSPDGRPRCLVGVKACDLKGMRVLDTVFADDDSPDPFYVSARENTLIISADCSTALDTCFCTAMDGKPFVDDGSDLNLSPVNGGFVVRVCSPRGESLVEENRSLFTQASAEQVHGMESLRDTVERLVAERVAEHAVPSQAALGSVVARTAKSSLWEEESNTCVECGACNAVCPTCHCFLLYDQRKNGDISRFRMWDSCLVKDFARVAGGANPRPRLWMRLRNRFEKKFDFFPTVKGVYACTGCGRCIGACPGKIDIRRVLKRNIEVAGA